MRANDRDLIRGGHYGQRSCEPHLKAEHMAAPTKPANVKKALANSEPSTHGTSCHSLHCRDGGRYRGHSGQTAVRGLNCSGANAELKSKDVAIFFGLGTHYQLCK